MRNAIQGHIDAEHAKKKSKSFQKTNGQTKSAINNDTNNDTDSEDEFLNDPQQLEVEHPRLAGERARALAAGFSCWV